MNTLKLHLAAYLLAAICLTPTVVFADTYTITDYSLDPDSYWGALVIGRTGTEYPYPTSPSLYDTIGDSYKVDTLTVTRGSNSFSAALSGPYFTSGGPEFVGDLFLSNNGWNPYVNPSYPGDTHYTSDSALNGETWEYVLHIMDGNVFPNSSATSGTIGLYRVDTNTGRILLSNETLLEPAAGYRANQDVLYAPGTGENALVLGTWALNSATDTFTFSLDNVDLAAYGLNGDIGLHWTMSCANDVIEGKMPAPQVPEPATMVLFGAGLSGLAAYSRRAKK